eukprot:scaffold561068_cov27-Prasinocladus_malaysianus.AAC.1
MDGWIDGACGQGGPLWRVCGSQIFEKLGLIWLMSNYDPIIQSSNQQASASGPLDDLQSITQSSNQPTKQPTNYNQPCNR